MVKGVGIDTVSIDRLHEAVDRRGNHFLRRVFTEDEIEYCRSSGDMYVRLAGRFAVKEAVFKALGHIERNRLKLTEIEIEGDDFKGIRVKMSDALKRVFSEKSFTNITVSLSHDRTVGLAVAVAIIS